MSESVPVVSARDDDFEEKVLKSPVPVLVDFGAAWCGPCRVLEPVMEGIAREHAGKLKVVKVDADEAAAVAARYRVRGLPTVIAFDGGKELRRHVGATNAQVLLGLLAEP